MSLCDVIYSAERRTVEELADQAPFTCAANGERDLQVVADLLTAATVLFLKADIPFDALEGMRLRARCAALGVPVIPANQKED